MQPDPPLPPRPISEGLRRAGSVSWAVLGMLLLFGVAAAVVYFVRDVFPPLALALMMVFLLNPLVSRLEARGVNRAIGTMAIYILLLAAIFSVGYFLFPVFAAQIQALIARGPEFQESAATFVEGVAAKIGVSIERRDFNETLREIQRSLFTGFGQIARISASALHLIVTFVVGPILALYVLIDLPKLQRSFVSYLPPRYREEWVLLLDKCGQALGGFFRGQLLVASIVGVMSSLLFLGIRLPFWLPIGMLAGFFNIIPMIGAFVGGGLAVIVALITGGTGLALKAVIASVVVQQIDNHFISPKVMGRAVRVHPVTVMVALLAGGTLAGVGGMLIAVPAMAVGKIVSLYYYETRVLGRLPDEPETVEDTSRGMVEDLGEEPPPPRKMLGLPVGRLGEVAGRFFKTKGKNPV